ncbi:FxSxx-COOH cyclophane-containing RiPP peptide [Kitasatospora sp. NPDC048365]|uniref:FXSXX-COOH protein n=1 Tax=Kitasatospora terrestris TaxID=258051 RepID=A0ABP9DXK1_9ACTN
MVAALATKPADSARVEGTEARPSLTALAALGAEELTADLFRALPGETGGPVAVAAFNSSI